MEAIVFGNATLDVLCYPVGDVPRYESLPFERAVVAPGGCGSNVAVGLCALGVPTALIARIGTDGAAFLVERYWARIGLDMCFIRRLADRSTAVSVGLVDGDAQPRFVHTPGANAALTADDLDVPALARGMGARGHLVKRASQIAPLVRRALRRKGPTLIGIPVDYSEAHAAANRMAKQKKVLPRSRTTIQKRAPRKRVVRRRTSGRRIARMLRR